MRSPDCPRAIERVKRRAARPRCTGTVQAADVKQSQIVVRYDDRLRLARISSRDVALSGVSSVRLMRRRLNDRSCYTRSDRRLVHDRLHDLGEPWCSMRRQHDFLH